MPPQDRAGTERAPGSRREVLAGALGALGLALGGPRHGGAARDPHAPHAPHAIGRHGADEPPFSISLAEWSLHRELFAGDLSNLDFPRVARDRFGLAAVEYVNVFFREHAADFEYLRALRRRAADAGVDSLLIMVDGEGDLADADEAARRAAVHGHFKWIAAAGFLGCHAIRVNARGTGTRDEQRARAAESLHRLAELGADYGVDVLVENHGGPSSDGAWLASVIRAADHPRVGTLPDFGNFHLGDGEWYDRYQGVRELMPFARAVSAKSHDFDADGDETGTDYRRMLRIVLDAGYRGWIGVEYEGQRLSETDGVRATVRLLERVAGELAAEGR